MLRRTLLLSPLLALLACGQETDKHPSVSGNGQTQLLFFMDPKGGPCQFQQQILQGMSAELSGKVTVRPISSRNESDHPLFSSYGVRALPTLVLADAQGKELRRMPPGIQSAETITRFLGPQGAQ